MPRYFFDVHRDAVSFDEKGTELADLNAVHKHLFVLAIEMMFRGEKTKEKWQIEALNEQGKIVATIDFSITTEGKLS